MHANRCRARWVDQVWWHRTTAFATRHSFTPTTASSSPARPRSSADAVAAGEPILVVVDAAKIAALRTVLDGDAERVQLADMATVGRNPARIIPAWRTFVDQHSANGQRLRGISEPIRAGRSQEELVECRHHEALLNEAFVDTAGFWLLCPYDTAALEPGRDRPSPRTPTRFIDRAGHRHPSRHYHGAEATRLFQEPLPEPPAGAVVYEFGAADLASVRHLAAQHAVDGGAGGPRPGRGSRSRRAGNQQRAPWRRRRPATAMATTRSTDMRGTRPRTCGRPAGRAAPPGRWPGRRTRSLGRQPDL